MVYDGTKSKIDVVLRGPNIDKYCSQSVPFAERRKLAGDTDKYVVCVKSGVKS